MSNDSRKPVLLFRAIMIFIAVFHLGIGGSLMISVEAQHFFSQLYGAQVTWGDETIYLIRVLGSFAFALGILACFAVVDPIGNRVVGWGFVALFLLRDVQRHVFYSELERGFLLSPTKNIITTLFFLVQAIILVVLLIQLGKQARRSQVDSIQ